MQREPSHFFAQPDQKRTTIPERVVVLGSIRRTVVARSGRAHLPRLTPWIRGVNPYGAGWCANATECVNSLRFQERTTAMLQSEPTPEPC